MRGIYGIEYDGRIVYVGQSINMSRRFSQHRTRLRAGKHRNFVLQRIFDKHPDALTYVVLEEVDEKNDLTLAEQAMMDLVRPTANLAAANGSHQHSEDARAKMSRPFTAEHRAALSRAARERDPETRARVAGWTHTPEALDKIAAASRGRPVSEEERQARSQRLKGRTFSAETREKMRLAKLGKPNEAVRQAKTGKKQSPEVVAKRVAAFNAAIARRREAARGAEQQD